MKRAIQQKLNSERGVNRLVIILVLVAAVLAVLVLAFPVRKWLWHGSTDGCDFALRRTRDMLRYDLLLNDKKNLEKARELVRTKGSFCPGGGDFYVIPDEDEPTGVKVVCGLHESDTQLRTELNAAAALDQVNAALADAKARDVSAPDTVEITLNSKTLIAERTEEEPPLRRGTKTLHDYKGTLIYYILNEDGELTFFCYADPDHCMRWRVKTEWVREGEA